MNTFLDLFSNLPELYVQLPHFIIDSPDEDV